MSKNKSRYIPEKIKKELLQETIYRCAYCLDPIQFALDDKNFISFAENAHIEPHCENGDNSYENLIVFCPNHHTLIDKGILDIDAVRKLKRQWIEASGKYSKLELDCLFDLYLERSVSWIKKDYKLLDGNKNTITKTVLISSSNTLFLFRNILDSDFLYKVLGNEETLKVGDISIVPVVFILTEKGKEFCKKFIK